LVGNLRHGDVDGKGLQEGCYQYNGIPNKIDAPSTDYICKRHEGSSIEIVNCHESVDCTAGDPATGKFKESMPSRAGIDSRNDSSVNNVACHTMALNKYHAEEPKASS
jgi:hypothetical protein